MKLAKQGVLRFSLLFIVFLLFFPLLSAAGEVDLQTAHRVASNWITAITSTMDKRITQTPSIVSEEAIEYDDRIVGYNFILQPAGHIIVPARDELPPVKLYSFTSTPSVAEGSEALQWIGEELYKLDIALDTHAEELAGVDFTSTANGRLWALFVQDPTIFEQESRAKASGVEKMSLGPLLSSAWDQGDPYNTRTPRWFNGQQTATGCVATAAAQIMKYWNYPPSGKGSTSYTWNNGSTKITLSRNFAGRTYDWNSMTDTYDSDSTAAQKKAVAILMSDVGIAFHMQYGPFSTTGSGANTLYGTTVFPTYFKYKKTVKAVHRSRYASDSAWMQVFKDEILAGRPSQLRLRDPNAGGHSVVVDGYRDYPSEQIHLNMGWSGSYSGWYVSNDIVTGGYSWSDVNYQAAVIGIEPKNRASTGSVQVVNGSTSYSITEVYLSPSTSWGVNQISSPITAGGAATVTGVPPGTYNFKAVFSDGSTYTTSGFSVTAGATTTITATPQSSSTGSVHLVNGSTSYSITELYLSSSTSWGTNRISSPIAAAGSITLADVSPGTYNLKAMFSDGSTYTTYGFSVTTGAITTITATPQSSSTGSVHLVNGSTSYSITEVYLAPASITPTWGTNQISSPITAGGSSTLTGVTPGAYSLKAVFSNGSTYTTTFTLTAGATATVTATPPTGPTAGYWSSGTGDNFYVTPDSDNVSHFSIIVNVSGCGTLKITYLPLVPITNNHFSFSGTVYASGTFQTPTSASGTDGLSHYYSTSCGGYINGGPWTYTATWQSSAQPAALTLAPDRADALADPSVTIEELVEGY